MGKPGACDKQFCAGKALPHLLSGTMTKRPTTIAGVAEAAALKDMAMRPGVPKPASYWVRRIALWTSAIIVVTILIIWAVYYLLYLAPIE